MILKFQSSIGSKLFEKVEKCEDFRKFQNLWKIIGGRGSCPSSFPSGNQVDGSPLVAIPNRSVFEKARPREDP